MKFFVHLKNALSDRSLKIDQVDIDKETVERFQENLQPLITEFVKKRSHPLLVNSWCGNIKDSNPNLVDCDAVVAIELIEHVFPDVFEEIPYQIFGMIVPKIVVITTPNCEFNILFKLKPGEFRHYDHKFEFSREQFNDYCNNLCLRFPNYYLQIEGMLKRYISIIPIISLYFNQVLENHRQKLMMTLDIARNLHFLFARISMSS
jgi:small RNA 2'-O-methyltransferase